MAILAGSGFGDPSSLVPKTETDRSSASPVVPAPGRSPVGPSQPQPKKIAAEANDVTAVLRVILRNAITSGLTDGAAIAVILRSGGSCRDYELGISSAIDLSHPPLRR